MSLNQTRYNNTNSNEESRTKKTNQNQNEDLINFDFRQENDLIYSEYNSNIFNSLVIKYKEEIKMLKNYIERLHREIRIRLNIEIPLFIQNNNNNYNNNNIKETTEKNLDSNIINKEKEITETDNKTNNNNNNNKTKIIFRDNLNHSSLDIEFLKNYLEEVSTNLTDIYYLNPILIKYDESIKESNEEITYLKNLNEKYENTIIELAKENKSIRDKLLIKAAELNQIISIKNESNIRNNFINEEDYIINLNERSNSLSKENEIILINYHKLYNDYITFQTNYLEKHNENMRNIEIFNKLSEELNNANINVDNLILSNQICENKIGELVEINTKLEVFVESCKIEILKMRQEINTLTESNLFYKNLLSKMNSD
jgi:hypothetical protein